MYRWGHEEWGAALDLSVASSIVTVIRFYWQFFAASSYCWSWKIPNRSAISCQFKPSFSTKKRWNVHRACSHLTSLQYWYIQSSWSRCPYKIEKRKKKIAWLAILRSFVVKVLRGQKIDYNAEDKRKRGILLLDEVHHLKGQAP